MNKSLVMVSIIAASVLLGACSDASGPASSTQIQPPANNDNNNNTSTTTPTLEGGVSLQTLQSTNGIKASPTQVEEDLQALANLGNISSTLDGVDGIGQDIPILGSATMVGQTKRQVSLAKKNATLVASGECFSVDTSYTSNEDGMEMSMKMQWLGSDGNVLRICQNDVSSEQEALALFNNSKMVMEMSGSNDSMSIEMKLLMNINMTSSGALNMDGSAIAKFDITHPVVFNMYMDMQFNMSKNLSSDEELEPEMTATIWFQNGRYKCAVGNIAHMNSYDSKVCDLENAGVVVGSLWNDESGEMIVKDANDNVVGEDAVINEEL